MRDWGRIAGGAELAANLMNVPTHIQVEKLDVDSPQPICAACRISKKYTWSKRFTNAESLV